MATTSKSGLKVVVAESHAFLRVPTRPSGRGLERRPEPVSEINVAQSPLLEGSATLRRMGHLLGYAAPPPLTSNPNAWSTPWNVPAALGCVNRDRQRRPHRPPRPRAGPGPTAPRRHPGRLENWIASAAPCGIWSTPSPDWPTVGRVPQPAGGDRRHQPRRRANPPRLAALAEFERDLIRERTAAGAGRRQGRRPPRRPAVGADRREGPGGCPSWPVTSVQTGVYRIGEVGGCG
jgi:hypothetical protein